MTDGVAVARRRVRFWSALAVLVVVGAVAGLVASALARPVYTATSTSFVSTREAAPVGDAQPTDRLAVQIQRTYASLATSPPVLRSVVADLRLPMTPEQLATRVRATDQRDTALLRITVSDLAAVEAATIANAIQAELAQQIRGLRPPGLEEDAVRLTVVRPASAPEQPSSPNVSVDLLLGALGGGALWVIVCIVPGAVRGLRPRGPGGVAAPSMF